MKTKAYLMAALIGMGSIAWGGCSDDEKIVEIEKIVEKVVVEQDLTKMPEAAREGLKGNPKTVKLSLSSSATSDEATGVITPAGWQKQLTETYNEAGYKIKVEEVTACYTELDGSGIYWGDTFDPVYEQWEMKTPILKPTRTLTITLGDDNRPAASTEETYSYGFVFDGDMSTIDVTQGGYVLVTDYWWETTTAPGSIVFMEKMQTKTVTTIDAVAKKATMITQRKEGSTGTWEDSAKTIADLNEYGYPNMDSKEEYDVAWTPRSKAFEEDPSAQYIEKLDEKGNWIARYKIQYGSISDYQKRDIVYY